MRKQANNFYLGKRIFRLTCDMPANLKYFATCTVYKGFFETTSNNLEGMFWVFYNCNAIAVIFYEEFDWFFDTETVRRRVCKKDMVWILRIFLAMRLNKKIGLFAKIRPGEILFSLTRRRKLSTFYFFEIHIKKHERILAMNYFWVSTAPFLQ